MSIETSEESLNIDDFIPMPGADSVISGEDEKKSIFSNGTASEADMSFIDEKKESSDEETKPADIVDDVLKDLDADLDENSEAGDVSKKGRPATDKSGLVEVFSDLIKEELIVPFDDDKDISEYSMKDWKELIKANIDERENSLREKVTAEITESLPIELQIAKKYVDDGGTDLKTLLASLAEVERTRELDPSKEDDQEVIARQYLLATNFLKGDKEAIEEQIAEWKASGALAKKVTKFKPELDEMQEEVVLQKLEEQDNIKKQQQAAKKAFMDSVFTTLEKGDLNGIKLDNKKQKYFWDELTQVKYESMSGRPTNRLGFLLEKHQFGKEPRYDLITEALWLLENPDEYKDQIRKQVTTEVTKDTVRKLKTEQSNKISSTSVEEKEQAPAKRTIPRQTNIFARPK